MEDIDLSEILEHWRKSLAANGSAGSTGSADGEIPNPAQEGEHDYSLYVGFTSIFRYCKQCDQKLPFEEE
jgi:hypothetical protein